MSALRTPRLLNQLVLKSNVHVEAKLQSLGYTLTENVVTRGNYVPYVRVKDTIYVAGHLPIQKQPDGTDKLIKGRLGENMTVEEGQLAAKLCGLQIIR
jgi:hypothetical protein